jgi:phosphatidylethanolamine-binding protein (PEBP) family uncharacterized protein
MSARTLLIALFASTTLVSAGCGGDSSGTPGTAGTNGGGGTTGAAGTTAAAGTTGAAGTTAAAGTNGAAGTTAAAGTNGAAGTTAAAGTNGAAGTTAAAGTNGAAGTTAAGGRGGGAGTTGNAGRGGTTGTAGTTGTGGAGTFRITSSLYTDGMPIPVDSTCATTMTNSRMPDLAWTGAPAGTMSFAIAFVDATMLPASTGFHSVIWDIPGNVSMLPYALPAGSPPMGIAGLESAKQKNPLRAAYLGPCPNMGAAGTGPVNDTYEFRLYAFGVATLPANLASMSTQAIITALGNNNPLGMAVLRGTSNARGMIK